MGLDCREPLRPSGSTADTAVPICGCHPNKMFNLVYQIIDQILVMQPHLGSAAIHPFSLFQQTHSSGVWTETEGGFPFALHTGQCPGLGLWVLYEP